MDTYVAKIEAPPSWWRSAPSWWPASMLWEHAEIDANAFRQRLEQMRQVERQRQGEACDVRAFESAENKRKLLNRLGQNGMWPGPQAPNSSGADTEPQA